MRTWCGLAVCAALAMVVGCSSTGGGGLGPPGSSTSGGGAGASSSGEPGPQRFQGEAGTIPIPGLRADALDLIHIYRSTDQGETWWTYYSECAGSFGSSSTTQAFWISDGQVQIQNSYCLSGEFTLVLEPAAQRFSGPMAGEDPTVVPIPGLTMETLPPFAVYFAGDDDVWWSNYQQCAGGPEVAVRDGAFELRRSYCNNATRFQVVLGAPPAVNEKAAASADDGELGVESTLFDPAAPPSLDVLWSRDDGLYIPVYAYCSGGPTFILEAGRVRTPGNSCTAGFHVRVTAR